MVTPASGGGSEEKDQLWWLAVDVPAEALATGGQLEAAGGRTIVPYLAPIPDTPNECQHVLVVLFRQPRALRRLEEFFPTDGHPLRARECMGHCEARFCHKAKYLENNF